MLMILVKYKIRNFKTLQTNNIKIDKFIFFKIKSFKIITNYIVSINLY